MEEKDCLESFKKMLSQAIMVGAKLSKHDYSHDLQDERGRFLKEELDCLYQSTTEFIHASGLNSLSEQQIFPVYEEMQKLAEKQVPIC